jgi:hypothetical protein
MGLVRTRASSDDVDPIQKDGERSPALLLPFQAAIG